MTRRAKLKRAVSNGDPVNDWKRIIASALTLATLCVSLWNQDKISDVKKETRQTAKVAAKVAEAVGLDLPVSPEQNK